MKTEEQKLQWLPASEAKGNHPRGVFLLIEGGGHWYPGRDACEPGALAVAIGFRFRGKWCLVAGDHTKELTSGEVKFWMPIPKIPKIRKSK